MHTRVWPKRLATLIASLGISFTCPSNERDSASAVLYISESNSYILRWLNRRFANDMSETSDVQSKHTSSTIGPSGIVDLTRIVGLIEPVATLDVDTAGKLGN